MYKSILASIDKNKSYTDEEKNKIIRCRYLKPGGRFLRPRIVCERSPLKNKKFRVILPDSTIVDYGLSQYKDYTQTRDIQKKIRYREIHINDNITDPHYESFWNYQPRPMDIPG